jgi:flagellar biosynthetic protein FliP
MRTSTRGAAPHHDDEAHEAGPGATWSFVRHYLEMVAAMMIGMAVGAAFEMVVDLSDRAAFEVVEMAAWMTVPMVGWMRFRGHGWRPCTEMAAAMVVPTLGVLALLATDAVTDVDELLMLEHVVMLPAMLVVMLLRRDEYTGHHHRVEQPATTGA